jgi:4-amino-4-deoxy-L-arabinose transferase-like glycosyltransferase
MKEHRAVLLFAFIWLVTGFVGLSAWPSKQSHYFLPYYPAMAILIASALGTAFAHTPVRFFRWTKAVMYATFSLMTVAPFVLVVVAWQAAAASQPIFMLLLAVPPAFFLLWLFIERRRDARRWASTATILAAIAYVYFLGIVVPAENATKGIKSFCVKVQAQVPYDEPLRCFGIDPPELSFYMNRVVRRINDENELRAYLALPDVRHVIIGNEWIAQLPDNGTGLGLVPVPAVETRLARDAHGMKLFVVKEKQP